MVSQRVNIRERWLRTHEQKWQQGESVPVVRLFVAIERRVKCPWCWQCLHLQHWYPQCWSSTICCYHFRRIIEQARSRHEASLHVSKQWP